MAQGSTTTTTIAYKLDPRGLREARKELEKTFKPASAKELNGSLKEMRGIMRALTSESARLTTELLKVKRGTQAFDELESKLRDVDAQMKRVGSSAASMAQSLKDAGHGSFSQGFLQGMSPGAAGFLERGPGMRRQWLGQQIGGGIRGGISRGIGATSSMLGGQGPLSTILGGIPFVGGAASAAEGAAGMAVDYQRARLAALPGVGLQSIRRTRRDVYKDVEVSGPAANAGMGDMPNIGSSGKARRAIRENAKAQADATSPSTLGAKDALGLLLNPWGYGGAGGVPDVASKLMQEKQADAVYEAGTGGKALPRSERRKVGSRSTLSTPFDDIEAAGRRALLTRTESVQAYGSFAQQVGGHPGAGAFGQAEAARALLGVDTGASAGLFRGLRGGGGAESKLGNDLIASTISDAMVQGLEGSEITDQLAQLAQLQEQMASRGVKLQTETISGMTMALSRGFGLEGSRGTAVGSAIAGAASDVALGGARGPVDTQLLRAAGFDPKGGKSSYFGALKKLESVGEGRFDTDTLFSFIQNLTDGQGGDEAGFSLQRALGSKGINIGLGEGTRMANAVAGGRSGFVDRMGSDLAQLGADGKIKIMTGADRGATGDALSKGLDGETFKALTGTIRAQNAIQDKLLAAGQETVGTVQKMQGTAADLAKKVGELEPLLTGVTTTIKTLGQGIGKIVDKINEFAATGSIPVRIE